MKKNQRFDLLFGDDEELRLSGSAEHIASELEALANWLRTCPDKDPRDLTEGEEWKLLERDKDGIYRDIAKAGIRCTVRLRDEGKGGV